MAVLVAQKALLHRHLTNLGVPVRPLLLTIGREAGVTADGAPIAGLDDLRRALGGLAGPVELWDGGRRIAYRAEGGALVDGAGGRVDAASLRREVLGRTPAPLLLVLRRPEGPAPVHRVVTLVDGRGRAACAPVGGDDPVASGLVRAAAPGLLPLRAILWTVSGDPAGPVVLDADAAGPAWDDPDARRALAALAAASGG